MSQTRLSKPPTIGSTIARVMRSLGLKRSYDGWQVVNSWPEIVGEELSRRATAIRYEDGVLYVAVPDDSWRQQLSMQCEMIIEQIHSYPFGRAVKSIRLQRGKKGN